MRFPRIVLLPILFCLSLTQDTAVEERKKNDVVKILDMALKEVGKLAADNITIPLVDLGGWGGFENVTLSFPKMTNSTDGTGKFGFKLNVNVSDIKATGYYNVRDVDIPQLFPVFGEGNFAVLVDAASLKLNVAAMKNYTADKFDFKVDIFKVQVANTKLHFENLMGDPHVSDFLNELLGNLIPSLVEIFTTSESLLKLFGIILDFYGNGVIECIENRLNDLENCIKELFDISQIDVLRQLVDMMAF